MKLLIANYLSSLKEREELDAVLPDLLSEAGFHVFSRPGRGAAQRGVDVAAVGNDEDGERKIFLFTVKRGDLTRQDWDGTPQGMRSSLDEIVDVYVRNRIPPKYADLKIVICLTFGGDIDEQVRDNVTAYTEKNTTEKISFDEWNGDKLAGMILTGILREEILPKPMRSSFQKAVAMVDEPEVAFQHFKYLVVALMNGATDDTKTIRACRQLYLCTWILFVWARDINNVDAPYRASERALLTAWNMMVPYIGKKNKNAKAMFDAVRNLIELHITIASELVDRKVCPHVNVRFGISAAIKSSSSLDINLGLFEVLGRLSLLGLWAHWFAGGASKGGLEGKNHFVDVARGLSEKGRLLIQNNSALSSPITDRQVTDICLFLQLFLAVGDGEAEVEAWLKQLTRRLLITVKMRRRYPTCLTEYSDLLAHPRDSSEEYFREATAGSTLVPVLALWLNAFQADDELSGLIELVREDLSHCTLQLWMPDALSEGEIYLGRQTHGRALTDLPLAAGPDQLYRAVVESQKLRDDLGALSAMRAGHWPIVLLACRHYALPIPPGFWIESLKRNPDTPYVSPDA
jgi:hypothetical protein